MRKVVHLGPVNSRGGMSTLISSLVRNPPEGWIAEALSSHVNGSLIARLSAWKQAYSELRRKASTGDLDLAHIHVTHAMSWWRKQSFMRVCEKAGIPSVVHIHSGRFDDFCRGISGGSVRRALRKKHRKTVVLEHRWLPRLAQWIPEDAVVVSNSSEPLANRRSHRIGDEVRLLVMSRDGRGKGHIFATRVLETLQDRGIKARLVMTGRSLPPKSTAEERSIVAFGWVDSEKRGDLLLWADFLLMPSDFEGSSMTVIEAMVSGLPCLVSPTCEETIGIPSLVLPLDDPRDWANLVGVLRNPEVYSETVEEVLSQASRFSTGRARSRWGEVYEGLICNLNHGD